MQAAPGSFRDPSGHVYQQGHTIYRTITPVYQPHWGAVQPFLKSMARRGLVLPYEEVPTVLGAWKTLQVERLPFVSFPYEWSFSQLKDAALLTLHLQKSALKKGLVLKDASAYNIQFVGNRPVFIDHLSFEVWREGTPWAAYKQFCTHFLAPLALAAWVDLRCGLLPRLWIDGVPLDVAVAMLPRRCRWNPGLHFHLYTHARLQNQYAGAQAPPAEMAANPRITAAYLTGLAESLKRLLESKALALPQISTEWADYYSSTNYSAQAADHKRTMVAQVAAQHAGAGLALDVGANTGHYTQVIAPHFTQVLAADLDPLAVERHYTALKSAQTGGNILPLVIDFSNPSPGIGFNNTERPAFIKRCKARFVMALAVIHHLRITAGIPLGLIAELFFSMLDDGGVLLLEFVPREDSQTQRLLALRPDIFGDYTLEHCLDIFAPWFECLAIQPIPDSKRHLLTLKKRAGQPPAQADGHPPR